MSNCDDVRSLLLKLINDWWASTPDPPTSHFPLEGIDIPIYDYEMGIIRSQVDSLHGMPNPNPIGELWGRIQWGQCKTFITSETWETYLLRMGSNFSRMSYKDMAQLQGWLPGAEQGATPPRKSEIKLLKLYVKSADLIVCLEANLNLE